MNILKSLETSILSVVGKILKKRTFFHLNLRLFYLSLKNLGILNYQNYHESGEEFWVNKILPEIINNPKPVFFDVGSNIGSFSQLLIERFPDAQIHCFEPHPNNFAILKKKLPKQNVILNLAGVSDKIEKTYLYDRADSDGSSHASLIKDVIIDFHHQDFIKHPVLTTTIDRYIEEKMIDKIDFLKIDTEGNEFKVLEGTSESILLNKIPIIQFEFNALNVYSRSFLLDFKKKLTNYAFFRLLPKGLLPLNSEFVETEIFAFQNIVAIKVEAAQECIKKKFYYL